MKTKNLWLGIWMALMLAAGSIAIGPEKASACSCAMNPSVNEAKLNSDAVFKGTVTSRDQPLKWFQRSSADPVTWTFQVDEVWKGKVAPEIAVTSAESGASCGYEFQVGQPYVVYAYKNGDSLDVSLCSRTVPVSAAGQDLAELGSGSVPPRPGAVAESGSGFPWWWIMAGIAAALASIWLFRRKVRGRSF
ncbi:hypothetical protein [Paenibacillus soyae]|uniref:Tissue inhibitor of metalloproteinase n=1 Tax=Paenibacillus soyae TaxID=2969249 RepID=A0A9X2MY13_9BACL|nr:hypothetical protein [Paenibacillus soyae]MCR2805542.1 hypothetical protein [Paenibacillus soyae]